MGKSGVRRGTLKSVHEVDSIWTMLEGCKEIGEDNKLGLGVVVD